MIYTFSKIIVIFSFLFGFNKNEFNAQDNYSIINYNSESIIVKDIEGEKHIVDTSQRINDLSYYPTQTTFYQIKDAYDFHKF